MLKKYLNLGLEYFLATSNCCMSGGCTACEQLFLTRRRTIRKYNVNWAPLIIFVNQSQVKNKEVS